MSQPAAAVIDLDAFRRARRARSEERPRATPRPAAPVLVMPVLLTWVPVWPVR
jgi:hypothetical protein